MWRYNWMKSGRSITKLQPGETLPGPQNGIIYASVFQIGFNLADLIGYY